MSTITFVVLATLVVKVIDWLKMLQNRQWNAAVTQVMVWAAGIVVLLITAQTQFAPGINLVGITLNKASGWDLVLIGLVLGSAGSVGWQTIANVGGGNYEISTPLLPSLKAREGMVRSGPAMKAGPPRGAVQ